MNRRSFLKFVAGALGTPALLAACSPNGYMDGSGGGAGGAASAPKTGGNCQANGTTVFIEQSHQPNHDLEIPMADVLLGVAQTYMLGDGGSGHTHDITLTPADFAQLKTGQGLRIESTGPGHTHMVTINCV